MSKPEKESPFEEAERELTSAIYMAFSSGTAVRDTPFLLAKAFTEFGLALSKSLQESHK